MSRIRVTLRLYDYSHHFSPEDHSPEIVGEFVLHPEDASPYSHDWSAHGWETIERMKQLHKSGGVTIEEKSFPDFGWRDAAVHKALAMFDPHS